MTLDTLVQVLRIVSSLFALLGLPMLFYAARMLKRMDERQAMHHQTLYGETGTNGLRSDVKALRETRHNHAGVLQRHEFELGALTGRVDELERRP